MIWRNPKERIVSEKEMKDDPRRGRAQHDRSHDGSVQVSHYLLEGEQHGRDRCVERRRKRRRATDGDEPFHLLAAQSDALCQH